MSVTVSDQPLDERILIFAPVGKDALLALDVLQRTDMHGRICTTSHELCVELLRGASVIMLTEEALEASGIDELMECLRSQPAWSDIPILLFADTERSEVYLRTLRLLEGLRNVVLLERPIRLGAVLSLIRSALRGRQRQYELRDLLRALAEAREDAEIANRLKDEFLATLSHELRTPLNAILGWTTMLRDGLVRPRQASRALDTIHRNATAQMQIVNDLLDVSRIIRGTLQLSPKLVALDTLAALAVESMTPAAEAKGVTIRSSIESVPLYVWADPDRLQQVFWNLLANAVKFTHSGGHILLTIAAEERDVRISVADNGAGIAPAFLPHVFDRFRQADGSATREHGGLGLGLSIVRNLVELHGGHMNADSAGVGLGSTFTVYLPLQQHEPRGTVALLSEHRPVVRTLDLDGVHLLIVDDDSDARELLRAMLSTTGARITEACSAREALRLFGMVRPDILLADVAMPSHDGYSMMRTLRALPDGYGAKVRAVAISAYARREDRQRALKAGFNDHVGKPVQIDELFDALERICPQGPPPLLDDKEPGANVH